MKKIIAFIASIALAGSITACGCQNSTMMDNTTTPGTSETTPTSKPLIDPTIIDPTFETNIPDGTVDNNSTDPFDETTPTGTTDNTLPRSRHFK